jgi:hypothetical protein
MALREGEIHVGFRGGISTKADEKTVPATQLLVLENGVFTRGTSIAKRNGYTALSQAIDGSTDTLTDGVHLGTRDNELLQFTPSRCYSHQPEANVWGDAGAVYSVLGSDRPVVRTGTQQTAPDHATNDGVSIWAWEDSRGGCWFTVTDATSGRIHIAPTQAHTSGISPRCVAVGAALHIYYAVAAEGAVYVIVVNPASPTTTVTPAILVDDLSATNPVYDAAPTTLTGEPACIAWHEDGTANFRVGYVHASGVLGSPLLGLSSVVRRVGGMAAASPIAVTSAGADALFVTSQPSGTTDAVACVFTVASSIAFLAAVTMFAVTSPLRLATAWTSDALNLWVAVEESAVAASNRYVTIRNFNTIAGLGTTRTQRSVGLASRAWSDPDGEEAFAYFVHDVVYFNTCMALRLSDSLCIARTLPGLAAGAPSRAHLPSAHVIGDDVALALPYRERLLSENNDQFRETGVRLVELEYNADDSHQRAQLGRGLYLAGACHQHYDGRQWTEQGFHVGPELIATANGASGSLTSATTYLYRVWYESTDAQGEVHRGPVSFGTLVTLGGGEDEVTLTLPMLRVTQKTNVRICVARSLAAKTGRTAEMFRVTSADPTTNGAVNGYVANVTTADTVAFVDRMSDATLATQEPLYTVGGILSNDPAPLGNVIAGGKSRLFATDSSDPFVVRFSQPLEDGYGVEFPPELVVKCDPFGGRVAGLAVQDGEVLVFQERTIRAFNGDGPLPNGDTATAAFSEPRLVTSDVGCEDPASIVLTPDGHMFKSAKGIYLINRSGQVAYAGAAAEAFNAQRTTAATQLPGRSSIVFLTDDGTTVLYDYLYGQWSQFTNHLGRDAAVVSGTYHYLRTDGRVFRETVGAYSDAGNRITLSLETAWIHVAEALQGFQRFWDLHLLGTWVSPHQLVIQHRTDYGDAWGESRYLDATGEAAGSTGWITGNLADAIGVEPLSGTVYGEGLYGAGVYGGSAAGVYQWRYHIGGRGQSVRFRFSDFERAGLNGASFELTEMLITGGVAGPAVKPFTGARSA